MQETKIEYRKTIDVELLSTLLSNPRKTRNTRKQQLIADCPFCGKHDHFFINVQKNHPKENLWCCKKCGEDGGLYKLMLKLDKLYLIEVGSSGQNIAMGVKKIVENNVDDPLDTILPIRKMPIGFKRIFDDDYLNSRKFLAKDYINHPCGYTSLKISLKDYVLIGIVNDLEIKSYMARYIGEDENKPKYLNETSADFAKLLFNVDSVNDKTKIVVCVEGGFDAVSTENEMRLYEQDEMKVVATFGKKISSYQLYKLKKKGVQTLIFLYDAGDAIDELKRYMFEAKRWFEVYAGIEMKGDPGSWNSLKFEEIMQNLLTPEQIWTDKLNPKRLHV